MIEEKTINKLTRKNEIMYKQGIKLGIENEKPSEEIAKKIFLSFPTYAFHEKLEAEFDIRNRISFFFSIPISSVQIAGSAKIGFSCHKSNVFDSKSSDLDVSMINEDLYLKYLKIAFEKTKGYTDCRQFGRTSGFISHETSFTKYLAKGIVRPDYLPRCKEQEEWFSFFNKLSAEYISYFKNINAGIYCSEYFFISKQSSVIENYKTLGQNYD